MDKHPYTITSLHPPPPQANTLSWFPISPALAATGAPRAAFTGHAHRLPQPRIITTAAKSLSRPSARASLSTAARSTPSEPAHVPRV
jgi:hypothetical protein